MKAFVVGQICYDKTVHVPNYPVENTKNNFTDVLSCGGGSAANAACLLGKWGVETFIGGVIGNDNFGHNIMDEFKAHHVNVETLETNYEKDTSLSLVLINDQNKTHTKFNLSDNMMRMKKQDISFIPDIFLFDGYEYMASKRLIEKYPNAIKIIDADQVTQDVITLCKEMKYIICSKDFAENATKMKMDFNNMNSLVNIYEYLNDYFKGEIIILLEEHGVMYSVNNQIKILPAIPVQIVDKTGVGDIFRGAFTYGIASGRNTEDAIKIANIAAGISIGRNGARASIPTLDEVNNFSLPATTSNSQETANNG